MYLRIKVVEYSETDEKKLKGGIDEKKLNDKELKENIKKYKKKKHNYYPDIGDYVRTYIQSYKKRNSVTILLASHNMSEVEKLCDSIIMLKNGKIIDKGTCEEIIAKHGRSNLEETFLKLARSKNEI